MTAHVYFEHVDIGSVKLMIGVHRDPDKFGVTLSASRQPARAIPVVWCVEDEATLRALRDFLTKELGE